jgi:hypothetical protein
MSNQNKYNNMKKNSIMNEREIVESILAKSKLKEEDVEEIDNLIKRDLFEKYYKTEIGA